jgi:hypothetical protein
MAAPARLQELWLQELGEEAGRLWVRGIHVGKDGAFHLCEGSGRALSSAPRGTWWATPQPGT